MLKIISFKICPFVQRVTALLEAKNTPYTIEYISLSNKPQWFLDISPNGQVPILITDNGTPLFESDAIAEYIDDITAPIESNVTAEQRAIDRAWSYMATKNYLTQCATMRSANQETLEQRSKEFKKIFAKAEIALADGPYFKGVNISNVDIAWLPLLHRAHIILEHTGYDLLAAYPKSQAWQQAVMKSAIVEKSVAHDFDEAFSNYYLSDKTYLGSGEHWSSTLDEQCASGSCC